MQKTGRKGLNEKLEELDNSLSAHPCLVDKFRLSTKKVHEEAKGALSAKARAKREDNMKRKLP